jgi:GAF domain-containing protein
LSASDPAGHNVVPLRGGGRSAAAQQSAWLAALEEIILAIGSSADLERLLHRVVAVASEATSASDAFIYLVDEERGGLILSAATYSAASSHVGLLRLRIGQGVTGWVAESRTTYVIDSDPSADPRSVFAAELGEDRYQSMLCVPISSRADRVTGVVSLWSETPAHFAAEHVRLAERIADLVAGALENARLYESTRRRSHVLDRMSELAAMTTSGLPVAGIIEPVTELACDVADADLSVLLLADLATGDRLTFKSVARVASPEGRERVQAARMELLAIDRDVRERGLSWSAAAGEIASRLGAVFGAMAIVPIRVAGEQLGALHCYRTASRPFTAEADALLGTIANQAALAFKNALLTEELLHQNRLSSFLRDLESGRLLASEMRGEASKLGLDPSLNYAFVVGWLDPESQRALEDESAALLMHELSVALSARVPGTRCTLSGQEVVALVPAGAAGDMLGVLREQVTSCELTLRERTGLAATFGISRPASSLEDFRIALSEAREVAIVGARLNRGGGVFGIDDVGHQLLLGRVADLPQVRDRYSTAVATLGEYDRVKGAALLETLSVFLDFRNRADVARRLCVHRNTLSQRLQRIEDLTELDLSSSAEWFPLQLALHVDRARRLREEHDRGRD